MIENEKRQLEKI